MFSPQGQIAIITGGSSGIGEAMWLLFASRGARVFIFDVDRRIAEQTASEIEAGNFKGQSVICNISSADEVREAAFRGNKKGQKSENTPLSCLVTPSGHSSNLLLADLDRLSKIIVA